MKRILMLLVPLTFFISLSTSAQTTGKLTIRWQFKGVEEGYDHQNKIAVFIDDKRVGESSAKSESKPNTYKMKVPTGDHSIRILNLALYEGNWEEHTIANDYSIDCSVDQQITFGKNTKINLLFDLDTGTKVDVQN